MSEGYMALLVSILKNVPTERAFRMLNGDIRKNRQWTPDDILQVQMMRQEGMRWKDIAKAFGVTETQACKMYHQHRRKLEKMNKLC